MQQCNTFQNKDVIFSLRSKTGHLQRAKYTVMEGHVTFEQQGKSLLLGGHLHQSQPLHHSRPILTNNLQAFWGPRDWRQQVV